MNKKFGSNTEKAFSGFSTKKNSCTGTSHVIRKHCSLEA
jgi:hypothetical protein